VKFHKLPPAVALGTDKPAMREAITLLTAAGVDVRRPMNSRGQLKLDQHTSYYPSRGTFYVDGEDGASPERGVDALKAWIEKQLTKFEFDD
jgi:hypothetical protein